ncbi:Synaptopodin-2 [Merluccius polli]|uniref:Synaptopodin-2 n=1 Tax=Merluccius polli TaxID=89951 RepID=A0AA47NWR7_MERPO|nr:Synaptopodin-2 [Merluccius polli]
MEPVPADHEDHDRWSGSEGSQESYDVNNTSDEEDYLSDLEPPQNLQYLPDDAPRNRASEPEEPWSPPEPSGESREDEDSSGDDTSDRHPGGSPGPVPDVTPGSSRTPSLASEGPLAGCISPTPLFSSSSASSSPSPRRGDMTLTQTVTLEEPLAASSSSGWAPARPPAMVGVGARGAGAKEQWGEAESPEGEEGGCREAPPAAVSSGFRPQGAEQAEQWSAEAQWTDQRRPTSHSRQQTRPSHIESESERHVKETKSKCKRIALLLTNAPNPQNKGALLFKKRRQRVRKFTLVSYGTGGSDVDHEDQVEGDLEFVTVSNSEQEEDYSLHHQEDNWNLDWENGEEMEGLSGTGGKGVMMFAQRRQRLDEIALEEEELRSRSLPAEGVGQPEEPELQNHYHTEETHMQSANLVPPQTYVDTRLQLPSQQQENIPQMTNQIPEPKPLVPNRTAKPFGFINSRAATMPSSVHAPVAKKHELKFKVPVPVNTSPQVWSPTGDIIASRDERISVPAKKTGNLPEPKRRVASKQSSGSGDQQLQNRGDRKSYIEPEEDFFSLGAEACNFMQPRSVKLKVPPPVAPKPTVDPNRQPWLSPPSEPFNPPRSPVSAGSQGQSYAPQQDWAPVGSSAQNQFQPTRNSWSAQPAQSPVSIKAVSPAVSPAYPLSSPSWNKTHNVAKSTASCPPQQMQPPKGAGPFGDRGLVRAAQSQKVDGPPLMGRGAELFAKRQSRMEKFVVDAETVQANQARSASPTASLPNSWRYSSIVRAPPPLSYNPILAPFYPPAATKQPPSTSPKIKAKTRDKPQPPKKHLSSLDVMKHQPYQLDSSLFRYEAVPEARSPSPKPEVNPIPKPRKPRKPRSAPSHSLGMNTSDAACQSKPNAPSRSPAELALGRSYSMTLPSRLRPLPSHRPPPLLSGGPPGIHFQPSLRRPLQRQGSWQEWPHKPPSPWEAACRSPLGSVDEAFSFQSLPASIASSVRAAGHRRSLPEPPAAWTHRVSLEVPCSPGPGHAFFCRSPPAVYAPPTARREGPAFCGPPFKPASRLSGGGRIILGLMGNR